MERGPQAPSPLLPPGLLVRNWRVEAWHGQGAYGAVYRAVRVGQEDAGPVAFKVSVYPWDMRFAREAELLSRLSHPNIPRLLDRGVLRHAVSGVEHPYFVMEWVEGTPLYAWAEQHRPSVSERCRVLAQVARALEAVHAERAVHRDVKGDNVLVRLSDNRPMLIDFGSGHIQGAERLTWQSLAPGTAAYQSPQAARFEIRLARDRDSYYAPTPADDLYALGVTAYRLVMGEYSPPLDVREDEEGYWHVNSPDPRPLLKRNSRVPAPLRELLLRLLSDTPEVRGTAAQAAAVLEAAALSSRTPRREPAWVSRPGLILAATGLAALLLWTFQPQRPADPPGPLYPSTPQVLALQAPDAGTAAVGDTSPTEPEASNQPPSEPKPVAKEPLPEPRPGQTRTDKKGQCPGRKHVPISGGCWVESAPMTAAECTESGYVLFTGKCYSPVLETPRKARPTSGPTMRESPPDGH